MDVDSLSAYLSPLIQALCGVWTAFVTLLPSEAPVKSGSGVGALGVSGQLAGFTEVVVISQLGGVSIWKTIEGSWFVLGMFLGLISLNHHGINVPVVFL